MKGTVVAIEISENATVHPTTHVVDNAQVLDNACVYRRATVCDNAQVYEEAQVYGNAHISGYAKVYGSARVGGFAEVYGNSRVYGSAHVGGRTVIRGNADIYKPEHVVYEFTTAVGGITLHRTTDGHMINVGCQSFTLDTDVEKLARNHGYRLPDDWECMRDYFREVVSTWHS